MTCDPPMASPGSGVLQGRQLGPGALDLTAFLPTPRRYAQPEPKPHALALPRAFPQAAQRSSPCAGQPH